ncbi:MAG: hypothetical protein AAGA48_22520 [Myxococcota bacterium]
MRTAISILLLSAMACGEQRLRRDWQEWYDEGEELDVVEPLQFTDVNYTFTGATPIGEVPRPDSAETWFSPHDPPTQGCGGWRTDDRLPVEITGVVTLHPRQYIKVQGCRPEGEFAVDSDEKYFGSYFVQDASGGFFVLGDSKVSKFDMGDRVTLLVRAVKESFGLTMISAHDVLEIDRGPEPIYFEPVADRLLADADIGNTVRVEGIVAAELGGFGEIYLCTGDAPDTTLQQVSGDPVPICYVNRSDEAPAFKVGLDVELQRRGIRLPVGQRYAITGPVLYSFNEHQVNVMRVGQLKPLTD